MTVYPTHLSLKHIMVSSRSLCVFACFATMVLIRSVILAQNCKAPVPKMSMSKKTKWLVNFARTRSPLRAFPMGRIISLMTLHLRNRYTCYVPHVCHGMKLTRMCVRKRCKSNGLQAADIFSKFKGPRTIILIRTVSPERDQRLYAKVSYWIGILPNYPRLWITSKRICQATRGMGIFSGDGIGLALTGLTQHCLLDMENVPGSCRANVGKCWDPIRSHRWSDINHRAQQDRQAIPRIRIRNVERPLESDRSQPFYAPSTFNFELQFI